MTCIVGLVDENTVYMGGDSAGVAGYGLTVRADEKVFIKENMIFGFTSSFRMGQIIQHCFEIPEHPDGMSDHKYLCSIFIDQLIACFKDKGYLSTKNDEVKGGEFLFGYKGKLYKVCSDFQVGESVWGFDACGCGEDIALGALNVSSECDIPEIKINKALASAEKFSAGVVSPFKILKLENETQE